MLWSSPSDRESAQASSVAATGARPAGTVDDPRYGQAPFREILRYILIRQHGGNIADELLKHISPLSWEHINPRGACKGVARPGKRIGELVRSVLDRSQAVIDAVVRVAAVSVDKGSRQTVVEFVHKLGIRHLAIYRDPDGRFASTDAASTAAAAPVGNAGDVSHHTVRAYRGGYCRHRRLACGRRAELFAYCASA